MVSLALYQPDIPQNVGAAMRLCACLGCGLHVIEPCGFPWNARRIRQSAMDYYDEAAIIRHASWGRFKPTAGGRLILLTTRSTTAYTAFVFTPGDILLLGRESVGVPQDVHDAVDARVTIPMRPGFRSLNVVNAAAMVLGEALRQTAWPAPPPDAMDKR